MNMTELVKGVTLTKACSIKADKDSDVSKTVTLSVKFDGVTLQSVFDKAMSSAVIQWQNGPGRSKFDTWKHGQVVVIDFKAPGKAPAVDPEVAMRAKLAGMSKDERKAYLEALMEEAE